MKIKKLISIIIIFIIANIMFTLPVKALVTDTSVDASVSEVQTDGIEVAANEYSKENVNNLIKNKIVGLFTSTEYYVDSNTINIEINEFTFNSTFTIKDSENNSRNVTITNSPINITGTGIIILNDSLENIQVGSSITLKIYTYNNGVKTTPTLSNYDFDKVINVSGTTITAVKKGLAKINVQASGIYDSVSVSVGTTIEDYYQEMNNLITSKIYSINYETISSQGLQNAITSEIYSLCYQNSYQTPNISNFVDNGNNTATITYSANGVESSTATITYEKIGIDLQQDYITMDIGETKQIDTGSTKENISYEEEIPSNHIKLTDDGKVTAIQSGPSLVKITNGTYTRSIPIFVDLENNFKDYINNGIYKTFDSENYNIITNAISSYFSYTNGIFSNTLNNYQYNTTTGKASFSVELTINGTTKTYTFTDVLITTKSDFSISGYNYNNHVGDSYTLVLDKDPTADIAYVSSSNTDVVTIDMNGKLTFKGAGTAKIYIRLNDSQEQEFIINCQETATTINNKINNLSNTITINYTEDAINDEYNYKESLILSEIFRLINSSNINCSYSVQYNESDNNATISYFNSSNYSTSAVRTFNIIFNKVTADNSDKINFIQNNNTIKISWENQLKENYGLFDVEEYINNYFKENNIVYFNTGEGGSTSGLVDGQYGSMLSFYDNDIYYYLENMNYKFNNKIVINYDGYKSDTEIIKLLKNTIANILNTTSDNLSIELYQNGAYNYYSVYKLIYNEKSYYFYVEGINYEPLPTLKNKMISKTTVEANDNTKIELDINNNGSEISKVVIYYDTNNGEKYYEL